MNFHLAMHTPACMASMLPPIVSMVGFSIIFFLVRGGIPAGWHASKSSWLPFVTGAYWAIMAAQAALLAAHVWMCHMADKEPEGSPWLLALASPGASLLVSAGAVGLYLILSRMRARRSQSIELGPM